MNSRNNVPTVEGAYTPSNNIFKRPLRTTSMSSIQSAPAHIPATTEARISRDDERRVVCVVQPLPVRATARCIYSSTHLSFSSTGEFEHGVNGIALVACLAQRWTRLVGPKVVRARMGTKEALYSRGIHARRSDVPQDHDPSPVARRIAHRRSQSQITRYPRRPRPRSRDRRRRRHDCRRRTRRAGGYRRRRRSRRLWRSWLQRFRPN